MGYRLQLSAEFNVWLAGLRASDPPTAELAAQALTALSAEGDRLGPPLVVPVPDRLEPAELLSALEGHYQIWLESLQIRRREAADAATQGRRLQRELAGTTLTDDQRAAAREQLAASNESQERLTIVSQQEQARADAFRTRKEVLKALYTAAQAMQFIEGANSAEAAARLDEIAGQIEQEVGWQAPAEGLLELRPGAPEHHDLRILFAVEPPGTAWPIAVLDGPDAIEYHYCEAVLGASEVLRTARAPLD
jgi:hypothetical protein